MTPSGRDSQANPQAGREDDAVALQWIRDQAGKGAIAGCIVTQGDIKRGSSLQARLLRDGKVIWTGKLSSLRRFKDDVSEVKQGMECGIGLDKFNDMKERDIIELVSIEKVAATL